MEEVSRLRFCIYDFALYPTPFCPFVPALPSQPHHDHPFLVDAPPPACKNNHSAPNLPLLPSYSAVMSLHSLCSLSSTQAMLTLDKDDIDEDKNYPSLVAVASVVIGIRALSLLKHQYHNIAEEDELIMQYILPHLRRGSVNRYYALQRVHRQHQKWATFQRDLTDRQFRRYFRMSKFLFHQLCDHIEDCVGPEEFKSEKYLGARLLSPPKFSNNIRNSCTSS